jgi:hypothetical protein
MHKSRFSLLLTTIILIAPSLGQAAPWIKATDTSARHRIEFLAASGVIHTPITQWPLMWGSILPDLREAQYRKLSAKQTLAINELMAQFTKDSAPQSVSVSAGWADQDNTVFGGFGNSNNAPQYGSVSAGFVGKRWAGELTYSYDIPDLPREQRKLDQSYLAGAFGNWGVTIGAIDRWWGPGWQSSSILSNNARPVPGISIQRNKARPFENAFLSWLGPWQLQAFAGQMESDRFVPHSRLLGLRIAFKPLQWLEVAASRTAQWGGEGRSNDFSSLSDLILGKDNLGDSGITQENEPGNQLAGIDVKLSFPTPWGTQGAYAQLIGEDESGYAPSRHIYTAGLDGILVLQNSQLSWFFERSDTRASALKNEKRFDYAYEHNAYKSGYRFKGRALGVSIDSDSTINTLGLNWLLSADTNVLFKWSTINLNPDGGKNTGLSGKGDLLELSYSFNWLNGEIKLGYRRIDSAIQASGLTDETISTPFLQTTWHW